MHSRLLTGLKKRINDWLHPISDTVTPRFSGWKKVKHPLIFINGEENSSRHVAMVAKFPQDY